MKKILLVIAALFFISSVGCCQQSAPSLLLTINSDKQVYVSGEEINIEASIKNNSAKEMIIFWSDEDPMSASGGGGTTLSLPNPSTAYAVYIKPGQVIAKKVRAGKAGEAGPAFTLTCNGSRVPLDFKFNSHQEIFTGSLTSNTIIINVEPSVSKSDALRIAADVCKGSGWAWEDVSIEEGKDGWEMYVFSQFWTLRSNLSLRIAPDQGHCFVG